KVSKRMSYTDPIVSKDHDDKEECLFGKVCEETLHNKQYMDEKDMSSFYEYYNKCLKELSLREEYVWRAREEFGETNKNVASILSIHASQATTYYNNAKEYLQVKMYNYKN
ncbi:MAG: hypothetical protein ABRQ39_30335, partial [Candidatus Eremiobacterota bacterium]